MNHPSLKSRGLLSYYDTAETEAYIAQLLSTMRKERGLRQLDEFMHGFRWGAICMLGFNLVMVLMLSWGFGQ